MKHFLLILSGLFIFVFLSQSAETEFVESYSLVSAKSSMKIVGTSNVHDWEMTLKNIDCYGTIINYGNNVIKLKNAILKTNVKEINSQYDLMDKIAHGAMKVKEFPVISFKAFNTKKLSENNQTVNGQIIGDLLISGVSKQKTISVEARILNDEMVSISGNVPVNMTDFGITPPKYMMGALKTDDEVHVIFYLTFKKI